METATEEVKKAPAKKAAPVKKTETKKTAAKAAPAKKADAKKAAAPKKPVAEKSAAKTPAKADKKAKPAKEAAPKKPAAEKDAFGFRKGSKKSEAAKLYSTKKGATLAEVKEKTGSTQLNLLKELEGRGFKIERNKEGGKGKKQITRYKIVVPEKKK